MSIEGYFIFLAASFLLWVTPGQDTLYIIARSMSQGRTAGIVSALGIGTGSLVHACLAIAGLSLVILTSPILFLLVKIIGGLYLIYLGISSLLSKYDNNGSLELEKENSAKIYYQGIATNVLNPKVALFFIAFLPQFVGATAPISEVAILGITFVIGGTAWCFIVAYFASSLAGTMGKSSKAKNWFNKLSGAIYISLGLNVLRAKV